MKAVLVSNQVNVKKMTKIANIYIFVKYDCVHVYFDILALQDFVYHKMCSILLM